MICCICWCAESDIGTSERAFCIISQSSRSGGANGWVGCAKALVENKMAMMATRFSSMVSPMQIKQSEYNSIRQDVLAGRYDAANLTELFKHNPDFLAWWLRVTPRSSDS